MERDELVRAILSSLDDRTVSRSERKALGAVLAEAEPTEDEKDLIEARVFEAVGERMQTPEDRELLHALRVALGKLRRAGRRSTGATRPSRVWFGPEDPMSETLTTLIQSARESLDVAVFTITDNRVSDALRAAHARGVKVRILSDDDKSGDRGSDIVRLARDGVPVLLDGSPHHFHHKFAVFDRRSVLTGSYNWTRGAANDNRENFMLTYEEGVVESFSRAFDALWEELARR